MIPNKKELAISSEEIGSQDDHKMSNLWEGELHGILY